MTVLLKVVRLSSDFYMTFIFIQPKSQLRCYENYTHKFDDKSQVQQKLNPKCHSLIMENFGPYRWVTFYRKYNI